MTTESRNLYHYHCIYGSIFLSTPLLSWLVVLYDQSLCRKQAGLAANGPVTFGRITPTDNGIRWGLSLSVFFLSLYSKYAYISGNVRYYVMTTFFVQYMSWMCSLFVREGLVRCLLVNPAECDRAITSCSQLVRKECILKFGSHGMDTTKAHCFSSGVDCSMFFV